MTLITDYLELTQKYIQECGENTILLMQVGEWYEVYGIQTESGEVEGSKLIEFSQMCDLTVAEKNVCVGKHKVLMAGFKDYNFERYLKKIQDQGFTAVVYSQEKQENSALITRGLLGIFSPGTYFQYDTPKLSNSIACIWVHYVEFKTLSKGKHVVVGTANIDIYTGCSSVFQFKEGYCNNPTVYDELERFISSHNPSEVILISNLPDSELDAIISYANIGSCMMHKISVPDDCDKYTDQQKRVRNCEKQTYQMEVLRRFYANPTSLMRSFTENTIATQAFCFLLDFIYQYNPQLVYKISEPLFENTTTRVTLENHSLKQLNIINDSAVKDSKMSCLVNCLNNCITPMGKRQFASTLLNPTFDETWLRREYDMIEHFMNTYSSTASIELQLKKIKDLAKFQRQIFMNKLPPKSMEQLYFSIQNSLSIYHKFCSDTHVMAYLEPFSTNMETYCNEVMNFIHSHIILDVAKNVDQLSQCEINFIQSGVNTELDTKLSILTNCETSLEAIQKLLCDLIGVNEKGGKDKKQTPEYVKIHTTAKNAGFGLVCTRRRCKLLVDALPQTEVEYTLTPHCSILVSKAAFTFQKQSDTSDFIHHARINDICKQILVLKSQTGDLIAKTYEQIVIRLYEYQEQLDTIISFITTIDVMVNKSTLAHKYQYCKPEFYNKPVSSVFAKGLRHALIEQFSSELYVTNTVELGSDECDGILLYGTNAVGKTTLIRALGVAVIMAQAGLYVPCSSFVFKPYKKIFTRIIGNDNIFKGLSTFEVEMLELRTILKHTDEYSLVLGDELCSGTETTSAVSIFVAGISHFAKCRSHFIFATHLHEIVDYDEIISLPKIQMKHMTVFYDKVRDTLVYDRKLKDGSGDKMYGIEVCKSLQLPSGFLEYANEIRMKYYPDNKSILSFKQSRYNAHKIVGICEQCGKHLGTETHHIYHQASAEKTTGIISADDMVFHKNNVANLMSVCEKCHASIHKQ